VLYDEGRKLLHRKGEREVTPVRVPKYIDAPIQMAFWEADEILPMILLFAFGIMTNTLTYMFFLMFFVTKWYQKYKSESRSGAVLHWMWWLGVYDVGGRHKNGLARLFLS
jgi:type IV conjugative transfer system protein TraL